MSPIAIVSLNEARLQSQFVGATILWRTNDAVIIVKGNPLETYESWWNPTTAQEAETKASWQRMSRKIRQHTKASTSNEYGVTP